MVLDVREIQRFITLGKISLAVLVKFLCNRNSLCLSNVIDRICTKTVVVGDCIRTDLTFVTWLHNILFLFICCF